MKYIRLTNSSLLAMVDDEMEEKVNQYKWCLYYSGGSKHKRPYASTGIEGKTRTMHAFIMHELTGIWSTVAQPVDHRNDYGLHNYKENLRFTTKAINRTRNRSCIHYLKNRGEGTKRWNVQIGRTGPRFDKCFYTYEEAEKARDEYKQQHGLS